MVEQVLEPTRWDSKQLLEKYLAKRLFVSMIANCKVEYDGRASSKLDFGDRSVVIKEDGTVIVHQPKGRNPVNWMPAGSNCKTEIEGDLLLLTVSCINPREIMKIKIKQVYSITSHKLVDGEDLSLVGTEADIAAWINENPTVIGDFKPAKLEEQTKYGFIDVFGYTKNGTPVAIEVKRYKAGLSAVSQLRRYVERLKKKIGKLEVRGVLAAPGITSNAKKMLEDWGYEFKQIQIPEKLAPMNKGQSKLSEY